MSKKLNKIKAKYKSAVRENKRLMKIIYALSGDLSAERVKHSGKLNQEVKITGTKK